MQLPGGTYTTNNSFHGAKVRNFYIFEPDEVDIEESALVFLYVASVAFLLLLALSLCSITFRANPPIINI